LIRASLARLSESVQATPLQYISSIIDEHRSLIRQRRLDRQPGGEHALVLSGEPDTIMPTGAPLGGWIGA